MNNRYKSSKNMIRNNGGKMTDEEIEHTIHSAYEVNVKDLPRDAKIFGLQVSQLCHMDKDPFSYYNTSIRFTDFTSFDSSDDEDEDNNLTYKEIEFKLKKECKHHCRLVFYKYNLHAHKYIYYLVYLELDKDMIKRIIKELDGDFYIPSHFQSINDLNKLHNQLIFNNLPL